jgi:hypothetical protein
MQQGSLALRALPHFMATMNPSDSRRAPLQVMHSLVWLAFLTPTRTGLPGFWHVFLRVLSPITPTGPVRCFCSVSSLTGGWLHPLRKAGRRYFSVTKLYRVHPLRD